MLDVLRADRVFESFLDIQDLRIDDPDQGLSASDRKLKIKTLRESRRARRLAAADSFEKYLNAKEDEGFNGTFFDWLIANPELVMAIIMKIISLFGL